MINTTPEAPFSKKLQLTLHVGLGVGVVASGYVLGQVFHLSCCNDVRLCRLGCGYAAWFATWSALSFFKMRSAGKARAGSGMFSVWIMLWSCNGFLQRLPAG